MKRADLHIHTTASDGQHTSEEVVLMAKEKGIALISITDHDTTAGVQAGTDAAAKHGIGFIRGVELSCAGKPDSHILGYNIDIHNDKLQSTLALYAKNRVERNLSIIEYLKSKSIHITMEEVQAVEPATNMLGKPHFAQVLYKKGYVSELEDAFKKYLNNAEYRKTVVRPKPSDEEGINLIKQAGGTAVLAHPGFLRLERDEFEDYLDNLISFGLSGMECLYSEHSPEQTEYFLDAARRRRLIITGGTDFHGAKYKEGLEIGSVPFYPENELFLKGV